jgi:SAM-dependent methyltransferase
LPTGTAYFQRSESITSKAKAVTTKTDQLKNRCYEEISSDYGVVDLPALEQVIPGGRRDQITVLELGCGAGHVSGWMKEKLPFANIIASDLVPHCLRVAQQNYPEVSVLRIDAEEGLPFHDGNIDLVVSSNLYEHLTNVNRHLTEIVRVLRSGGSYFISTPHLVTDVLWTTIAPKVPDRFGEILGRLRGNPRISHCNLQTIRSLSLTLRQHGFTVQTLRRNRMSSNEREKLERLAVWLPVGSRKRVSQVIERLWIRLPRCCQPTIAVNAVKSEASSSRDDRDGAPVSQGGVAV